MSEMMMRGFGMPTVGKTGWLSKPRPTAAPLGAILRPRWVAPCTSDVHTMHGGSGPKENLILGHEAIGEVIEVGALVTKFKAGDLVVVPSTTPDWLALGSQKGTSNAHDVGTTASFKFLTVQDGVFAEFFHVNQADANLALLPGGISPEAALMTVDMMSTGFHGAELADIGFGDTVVVLGIGPVGLMAVAAAALRGAGQIIAVGTRPSCVEAAHFYGATEVLSYKDENLVKQVKKITGGGADKVIIASDEASSFGQAVAMCRAMGTVVNLSFFDPKDMLTMTAGAWGLGMGNKDIRGGFCPGGALRIEKMLALIRHGRVDPTRLITHRFQGFEAIEEAFLLMARKDSDLIKPIVAIQW